MNYNIKVFDLISQKDKNFLKDVIVPDQTHSNNIVELSRKRQLALNQRAFPESHTA